MKDPKKRLIHTSVLAIVFMVVYSAFILFFELRQYNDLIMRDSTYKADTVRSMIAGYKKAAYEVGGRFWEEQNAAARLMTIKLRDQVVNGEYSGDRLVDNGLVVRVRNGQVELPPEAEGLFTGLTPEMITNEYMQTRTKLEAPAGSGSAADDSGEVILTSGRIDGEWYYIAWIFDEAYKEYIRSHLSEKELLEALEYDNDTEILVVQTGAASENTANAEEGVILYKTKGLAEFDSLDDLGITREDLKKDYFTIGSDKDKKYFCIPIGMDTIGHTFVTCNSVEGLRAAFIGDSVTQILLVAAMLTGLIVWCFSVQWLVGEKTADEDQKRRYDLETVRKRTTRLAVMSTAVVTFFAFLTVMMQCMFQENRVGINMLSLLQVQVEEAAENGDDIVMPETERYERLGEIVAAMLTDDRELLKEDRLSEISEAIAADYIMAFDENGTQTACSREYIGFSLPTDESSTFSDFRRLLKGIPSITHDPERDFITGETRAFVGMRFRIAGQDPETPVRNGALLIALPSVEAAHAEEKADLVSEAKKQVYSSMQTEERQIIEIDPKTNRIISSSRNNYAGSMADGLGIDPDKLSDRRMGFYRFDDEWYFGTAKASDNALYLYLTDSTGMSRVGILFALTVGALFLIIYLLTAKYALKDYDEENYERNASGIAESADRFIGKIEKKAPSLGPLAVKWRNCSPEEKTKVVLQLETGIIIMVLVVIAIGDSPLSRHSALNFAIKGNWSKGLNLFSVIAVSVICCCAYLIFLLLKVVFSGLYHLVDNEGNTILGLIQSLLNYVIIIAALCVSLNYFGIDATTILASLGIFSLAISLGAKDMVTDIIAGLSILLEKTYSVGDYVMIGDFKGKVQEIGVRSTKLVNGTHDVKIISNHEISNVINYSRETSVCVIKIRVPAAVSVSELKKLFDRELPEVAKNNPDIISGPKFDGIKEIYDDKMTISISAECLESNIYGIELALNEAIQSMAERKLLQLAQNKIVVSIDGSDEAGER